MSKSYKKIYSGNTVEVHRFCDELESININPVVKDPEESARLGGFGAFYTDKEIWVHEDEFNQAQELLNKLGL